MEFHKNRFFLKKDIPKGSDVVGILELNIYWIYPVCTTVAWALQIQNWMKQEPWPQDCRLEQRVYANEHYEFFLQVIGNI